MIAICERDINLDILKGIGILAVIVGHLTSYGRQLIFSFHMPLFFIISGYLFHKKHIKKSLKSDFKRLIVPYIVTSAVIITVYCLINVLIDKGDVLRWIVAAIWGSGSYHNAPLLGDIPYIGAIWFLLALFWCKNIFLLLSYYAKNLIILGLVCLIISLAASYIDNYVISLPLAFLPGCAAVLFYYVGYVLHLVNGLKRVNLKFAILLMVIWIAAILIPERPLAMVICDYPLWPLSVFGGIAGTLLLYYIARKVISINMLSKWGGVIGWIGECSLVILCLHLIDLDIPFRRFLGINSAVLAILFDISFCIIGTLILSQFESARRILKIKKFHYKY